MKLSTEASIIAAALAALAVGLYVLKKNAPNLALDAGAGVVRLVADVGAGAAIGLGDVLGVPHTNETECEKAKREGRKLDASFACPAGDFISWMFN